MVIQRLFGLLKFHIKNNCLYYNRIKYLHKIHAMTSSILPGLNVVIKTKTLCKNSIMKKRALLLLGAMAGTLAVSAQSIGPSTLNSAGGSAAIGGNTYEWSLGEMTVVSTYSGGSLVVTQGLLQPFNLSNGIHEHPLSAGALQVYPNPAEDVLYLQPAFKQGDKLSFALLDMTGKLILREEKTLSTGTELQTIRLTGLAAGNYMLQVAVTAAGENYNTGYKVQKLH